MKYSDKLRDPRWQKRRLEVMEAAGWKCVCCGDEKTTLNVHHLVYRGEPWDAPADCLECLCETCHEWREAWNRKHCRSMRSTAARRSAEPVVSRVAVRVTAPRWHSMLPADWRTRSTS